MQSNIFNQYSKIKTQFSETVKIKIAQFSSLTPSGKRIT